MKTKKKFTFISQGCRLNHSETAGLINDFKEKGLEEVSLENNPDIVIINTCTVTENGDKDTKRLIRKIDSTTTAAEVALIGCQAQIKKDELNKLKGVKWVIGNENKNKTSELVLSNTEGVYVEKIERKSFFQEFSSFDPKHTRVNLKIQDGCDFYCSFCIIPFARGPARSRDFDNIINDAKSLINLGVKEIVLTGINLGTYNNSNKTFYNLLETLLKLNSKTRIRISSIEPTTINETLINLWKTYPNFCRYLHLPIQSGTNEVLEMMRRKYTTEEYLEYVHMVKKSLPDICIGTDVIVGFPGETDELFNSTYELLKNNPIDYFHVFSYSERSMAHSRKFSNPVESNIIKERSLKLRRLHKEKWESFIKTKLNTKINVLFEQEKHGFWVGTTEHFIKIKVKTKTQLKNKNNLVKIVKYENEAAIGELS